MLKRVQHDENERKAPGPKADSRRALSLIGPETVKGEPRWTRPKTPKGTRPFHGTGLSCLVFFIEAIVTLADFPMKCKKNRVF